MVTKNSSNKTCDNKYGIVKPYSIPEQVLKNTQDIEKRLKWDTIDEIDLTDIEDKVVDVEYLKDLDYDEFKFKFIVENNVNFNNWVLNGKKIFNSNIDKDDIVTDSTDYINIILFNIIENRTDNDDIPQARRSQFYLNDFYGVIDNIDGTLKFKLIFKRYELYATVIDEAVSYTWSWTNYLNINLTDCKLIIYGRR